MAAEPPEKSRLHFLPILDSLQSGPRQTPVNRTLIANDPEAYFVPEISGDSSKTLTWEDDSGDPDRLQILSPFSNASTYASPWLLNDEDEDIILRDLDYLGNLGQERAPAFELQTGILGEIEAGQLIADCFLNVKEFAVTASINGLELSHDINAGDFLSVSKFGDNDKTVTKIHERTETVRDYLSTALHLSTSGWLLTVNIGWSNGRTLTSTYNNSRFVSKKSAQPLPMVEVTLSGTDDSDDPPDDIYVLAGAREPLIDSRFTLAGAGTAGEPVEDDDVTFLGRQMLTHHTGNESYSITVEAKTMWGADEWRS